MMKIFINRVFRAIKIDIDLYEEVEKDKSATLQAGVVVVLSSLAAGVGSQLGMGLYCLQFFIIVGMYVINDFVGVYHLDQQLKAIIIIELRIFYAPGLIRVSSNTRFNDRNFY